MPVSVGANKLSVVHSGSNGVTIAFPDVCKTPAPPAPFVPIPYPNIAKSGDTAQGAKKVACDGNPVCVKDSNFMLSSGDEAGTLLGVASNKIKGKAEFVNFSFDVQVEGKGVPRAFDLMLHNDKNTPPVPLIQGPIVALPGPPPKSTCVVCNKEM
jgi:hypothetical protein